MNATSSSVSDAARNQSRPRVAATLLRLLAPLATFETAILNDVPMRVRHLNCGTLHCPPNPKAACHCLLLERSDGLTLIDTGIGLLDVERPLERIGRERIDLAGFQFREEETAIRRVERLGFAASDVTHIVLTHCDPDHTGGLADFPDAQVHVAEEEFTSVERGHFRYLPAHFAHGPKWKTCATSDNRWLGLEARAVDCGAGSDILLVPLVGHTSGHCGVAIHAGDRWLFHVGDAYYLRVELATDDEPISALAAQRADDGTLRRASLEELRRLARNHADEVEMFGYHDFGEFPSA